jgi:hypothetical protein
MQEVPQRFSLQPSVTTMGTMANTTGSLHSMSRGSYLPPASTSSHRQNMMVPPHLAPQLPPHSLPSQDNRHLPQPPTLASHGLLKILQSNLDSHSYHGHYADLSDPPDLYPSLHEEPSQPPSEDMNPSDADMVPYEQELRFDGDLYTPKLVRGHGNKREGWCGICKPGRWLVLKNSAYWYDKSFTHGISAATGAPFHEPLDKRRMDGNPDVWEGLCGSCNKWIALVSSKKKGTTWFRHAYKVTSLLGSSETQTTNTSTQCHTHPKVKDTPKRRRDNSQARLPNTSAARSLPNPRTGPSQPTTPPPAPPTATSMNVPNGPVSQFMQHPQQQLGPLTPPQSMRSSVGRHPVSSPAAMYGGMM